MIDMAMGDEDPDQLQPPGGHHRLDTVEIAPWIDDHRLAGGLAPEKGAVLLEGSYGDDLMLHDGFFEFIVPNYRTPLIGPRPPARPLLPQPILHA